MFARLFAALCVRLKLTEAGLSDSSRCSSSFFGGNSAVEEFKGAPRSSASARNRKAQGGASCGLLASEPREVAGRF